MPPKIGEVTSWLLRRAEDLSPRQQQLLTELRGHCAQIDCLAEHVTSFAKMMTKRTGNQELAAWLKRAEAGNQPELHTFGTRIRQDLAPITARLTPALQLRDNIRIARPDDALGLKPAPARAHRAFGQPCIPDQRGHRRKRTRPIRAGMG